MTKTANDTNTNSQSDANFDINQTGELGERITKLGYTLARFTTATVLGWIGAMKFTAYEAGAIEGLATSSLLTSWLYSIFSVQGASNFIGTVEIIIAILLIAGAKFPKAALAGAVLAAGTFATTASYLLTAPVWEATLGGFPALNVVPGQFLLKDIVLLSVAVLLAGEALKRNNI